jgi:hypothetical protein
MKSPEPPSRTSTVRLRQAAKTRGLRLNMTHQEGAIYVRVVSTTASATTTA